MFEVLLGGNFFRRPVQCRYIFSKEISSIEVSDPLSAFHKGVVFTFQAVELQSKKVSFSHDLFLRESSPDEPRSLANAALDILTILLMLLWLLISAQVPKTREQM